jgi:hypothetical protein
MERSTENPDFSRNRGNERFGKDFRKKHAFEPGLALAREIASVFPSS